MRVEIKPSKARGIVSAPPSKSFAHRYLICAGLADGESVIRNLAFSEDIKATIACLNALGAEIRLDGDTAYIKGTDVTNPTGRTAVLPCNESGSTLRFFIPLCLLSGDERVLTGSLYLMKRPLSIYERIAQKQELRLDRCDDRVVTEGKLKGARFDVPGNISSQFISGLLFALPFLDRRSQICVSPPVESFPYIHMTDDALKTFGITVEHGFSQSDNRYYWAVSDGRYTPADVTVEGDCSNAAFFEALNCAGGDVKVEGIKADSLQGDRIYQELFEKLKKKDITDIDPIDISDCPDLGPVLFAVAALCGGGRFTGTYRLKIKESDRANAMKRELSKLGVRMDVEENDVTVHPAKLHPPTEPLYGHNDHRIAMALSVLLTVTGGVIEGAQAVNKSFPNYFDRLKQLGVEIEYGMDQ